MFCTAASLPQPTQLSPLRQLPPWQPSPRLEGAPRCRVGQIFLLGPEPRDSLSRGQVVDHFFLARSSIIFSLRQGQLGGKDEPRSRTTWPSRSVSRKRRCLRVMGLLTAMKFRHRSRSHHGAHTALQRCLGQDVVSQIAQHTAGVGQLGAAQVDLVVCHSKTCCPPETKWGQACGRC